MSADARPQWPERQEYGDQPLTREHLTAQPVALFADWFAGAVAAGVQEANGVCLCTNHPDEGPDGRIVLLKDFDSAGFQFFTNYEGSKAAQMALDPRACMVFWWQTLRRQVRIRGTIERLSSQESDSYFASRPRDSQLGAWASSQSQVIASREVLEQRLREVEQRFPEGAGPGVPRPPHWGGYRLVPSQFEFWQGRDSRLHDRFVYRQGPDAGWIVQRLMP